MPSPLDPHIKEKQFLQLVYDTARRLGWLCYHPYRSDKSTPGYPDLTMTKNGRLIFAELKREGKKATPTQQKWLFELALVDGVQACLWWPSDWETILETLQANGEVGGVLNADGD